MAIISENFNQKLFEDRFVVRAEKDADKTLETCLRVFGMAPEALLEILKAGFPDHFHVIVVLDDVNNRLEIRVNEGTRQVAWETKRVFLPDEKVVSAGNISSFPEYAGQGYGTLLLFNQMRLFKEAGYCDMRIYAGSRNGGYTWARYGFLLTDDVLDLTKVGKIKSRAATLCNQILPSSAAASLRDKWEKIDWNDPKAIWKTADINMNIKEIEGLDWPAMLDFITNRISSSQTSFVEEKERVTIGQVLFMGIKWPGIFDFNNAEQIERMEKYVGRSFETGECLNEPSQRQGMKLAL